MFDYIGISILVVLLLVFGALTARALRARRVWVRWLGGIPAGLLTLVFGAGLTLALLGFAKINTVHANPVHEFTADSNPETLARGEKFARACAGCHSPNGDLPLTGQDFMEGAPFGTFYAPSLTQAHLQDWSNGEIARAIREGVGKNGRSLMIMPSSAFHSMSDDDVQALVAYLRSQPADAPNTPANSLNVLGAIMFGSITNVQTVQSPIEGTRVAPAAGVSAEYGAYLSTISGCRECHGEKVGGGVQPESGEMVPSLHPTADWSDAEFIAVMRTGVLPNGEPLGEGMPWKDFEKFSDDDFRAIHAYIQSVK